MATYFHGGNSEMQSSGDGLQTLYLMNSNNYLPYSDNPHHHSTPNLLLLNPNAPTNALNLPNLSHAPPHLSPTQQQQHHHLVGVTNIIGSTASDDPSRPLSLLEQHQISGFNGFNATGTVPRLHYNLWPGSIIDQKPSSTAATTSSSRVAASTDVTCFRRPIHQQGLSLSLSSDQQTAYGSVSTASPTSRGGGCLEVSPSSVVSNGVSSVQGVIMGSKYLKAAQDLLDEVVNVVGKGIYKGEELGEGVNKREKMKENRESTTSGVNGEGSSGGGENNSAWNSKQVAELSTAQRQELQMKKSKLVCMIDEVEQRYKQYHHQMQIVVSSFEQVAGYGAAKSYTALALKTISKQFRCLKDAISSQIRATSKTLGEDDCVGAKVEGSRLRYVDHHLRQQRALQQLGMIQNNAWRPQRGLPERAVSILRAWLFEHFLHPYPKDSDKVMLAKQTGLTRSQVSNWFINARVRLWKPMVEEMYLEEIKEQEHNNDNNTMRSKETSKELGSTSNAAGNEMESSGGGTRLDQIKALQSSKPESISFNNNNINQQNTSPKDKSTSSSLMSMSPNMGGEGGSLQSHSGFHIAGSSSIRSPNNKPRSNSEMLHNSPSSILNSVDMGVKQKDNGYPFMGMRGGYNNGSGAFSMEDIGSRFNVNNSEQLGPRFLGNSVSLTLGLPHNNNIENLNLPISGTTQHGFLSQNNMHLGRRQQLEMGINGGNEFCAINTTPQNTTHSAAGTTGYENIHDIQNRKRFAAQLLPDFVA